MTAKAKQRGGQPVGRVTVRALMLLALLPGVAAWLSEGAAAACPVEPQGQRAVTAIIDGERLRLDDGSDLMLSGVLLPRAPDDLSPFLADTGGAMDADHAGARAWPPAEAASQALTALASGRSVTVGTLGRSRDRYGQLLGHVTVLARLAQGASAGATALANQESGWANQESGWLQAMLVERGLARVQPAPGQRPCSIALLALEGAARAARRGLWANPAYAPMDATRPRDILKREHGFVLVEGTVVKADPRRTMTYLNFGTDRRQDFTVLVTSALASDRHFAPGGLVALAGRRIRVRGWVEYAGGPSLRVTVPEQIELLD